MMPVMDPGPPRTWNPDVRPVEERHGLRRRDMWFFVSVLVFALLLYFVWQQNRGLKLADEVARLEARREALRALILEKGVAAARLRQPDLLVAGAFAEGLAPLGLAERVFVQAPAGDERTGGSGGEAWLAAVGLEVPSALAGEGR